MSHLDNPIYETAFPPPFKVFDNYPLTMKMLLCSQDELI